MDKALPLTKEAQNALKLGFIRSCLSRGLSEDQTIGMAEKVATDPLKYVGGIIGGLSNINQQFPKDKQIGALGALGILGTGAAVGGSALGLLAAKLRGNYRDKEDIQKQELIEAYRNLAKHQ